MKRQMFFVLLAITVLSLSLVYGKGDDKASCCQKATKASLSSTTKSKNAKMSDCTGTNKASCCQKGTKTSLSSTTKCDEAMMSTCTDAEKAQCPMMKNGKASLKKTNGKSMDCCKGKAKASQIKNSKATQDKNADGKGTN